MSHPDCVTLLLEGSNPTTKWDRIGEPGKIVRVPSFPILEGAVVTGTKELGIEIASIVIDRAVDEDHLLEFLCRLVNEFRGDVLAIMADGSAYLSSPSRGDGRMLYRLGVDDVQFYLFARFGVTGAQSLNGTTNTH